ncbi:hypothetical protein ACRRTK_001281 [Alexandromys fortis]
MRGRFCKREALRKTHGEEDGHWVAKSCQSIKPKPEDKMTKAKLLVQRLRVLAALPEGLSSIPSNHMVAHNHL